jgi:phage shock protein PspC (stress-responsive transcriptional regulator)
MNKTITINLSGVVFHIDEQAYDKLKTYLNTIRSYFKNTEGGDDIVADIESRVAELFQERIGATKQALLDNDVDAVIQIMGTPESFVDEETINASKANNRENNNEQTFAYPRGKRRVFRNPDDKVLGGVCSGIANYFDVDPLWIRLALAITFFGFGSGLLIYILLWIIIPEAKTTAEKLEMRGEPVNISNIERSVKEEMDDIKTRMNNFKNDVNQGKYKNSFQAFLGEFGGFISSIFRGIMKFIIGFIGIIFTFAGIIILIVLGAMFFGSDGIININSGSFGISDSAGTFDNFTLQQLLDLIFVNQSQITWATLGLILVSIIPVMLIIFSGVKILFKIKGRFRVFRASMLALWTIGLIICIAIGIKVSNQYSQYKNVSQTLVIPSSKNSTLYLASSGMQSENGDDDGKMNSEDSFLITINNKDLMLGYPKLNIVKSENDSTVQLVIKRISRGSTKKEAIENAEDIVYEFSQKDSMLLLNNYFKAPLKDKWRGQQIKLTLKIPVGQTIYLKGSLESIMYDIKNVTNTYDSDMLGRRWKMTEEGLKCVDCEGLRDRNKEIDEMIKQQEKEAKRLSKHHINIPEEPEEPEEPTEPKEPSEY